MLSEAVFLLFILGCLFAVGITLWLNRADTGPKYGRAERTKAVAYLTRVKATEATAPAGGGARRSGNRIGGSGQEGVIVATEPIDPALAPSFTPSGKLRASSGEVHAGAAGAAAVSADMPVPVEKGESVFVASKRGLPISTKHEDVWTGWADVNARNIGGTQGTEALGAAFDLAMDSRARGLLDDLSRKGIEVAFGQPDEFSGEHAGEIATFDFSPDEHPGAGAPARMPRIRFNPVFLGEEPKVLAAALVHEATHFQQFLDGSLFQAQVDPIEVEMAAWSNEAAFWDEIRGGAPRRQSVLENQAEFAYRTALRGEAAMRDLLEALHG